LAQDPITAGSRLTDVRAGVSVVHISVVAVLTILQNPVAAAGALAGVTAAVFVDLVAVVAIFKANEDKAVTAAGFNTATHTAVVVGHVAVVAGFKTGFVVGEIRPHCAIATTGEGAVVAATVVIIGVAVITVFVSLRLGVF